MKRYSSYRNVDTPWLREMPKNWNVLPNIALFDERIERGFNDAELLAVSMKRGITKQSELEDERDSSNEDKSAYKRVCVGDIAYNKMRMWQGAVGVSDFDGIVSPAYVVLKPKRQLNPKFYHYLFRTPLYTTYSYRNSYGICDDQLSLRYFNFKRMQTVVPPINEQDAIVAFLETKEQDMATFIANKRQMIELLEEQKTALINQAVTRGLNPNTPMKPSCIPWLGKIPKHWEVKPLRHLVGFQGGGTPSMAETAFWNGTIPWVSPKDMKVFEIYETEDRLTELGLRRSPCNLIPLDSVLMVVRSGILQHSIPVAINRVPVALNQDMKALVSKGEINSEYLVYLISSKQNNLLTLWRKVGATVESLEQTFVKPTMFPVPPQNEQIDIAVHVGKILDQNATAIATAEREIELMEEYRTALIASAVTGKIDVRNN